MLAVEARQEAIANNIANASTAGYKRSEPVTLGFYEIFSGARRTPAFFDADAAPGGGLKIVETSPDLSAGTLQTTENPFSMALQGPGYFTVDTPAGERYTRAGSFTLDRDGGLVTQEGYPVQSTTGQPIDARGGKVVVSTDGTVRVDGVVRGQVRVVEFEDPRRLTRTGDSLFSASEAVLATRRAANATQVQGNATEMSNVNLPREMTSMMLGLRAYEANQRSIQAIDSTMSRLIEQVGMPS